VVAAITELRLGGAFSFLVFLGRRWGAERCQIEDSGRNKGGRRRLGFGDLKGETLVHWGSRRRHSEKELNRQFTEEIPPPTKNFKSITLSKGEILKNLSPNSVDFGEGEAGDLAYGYNGRETKFLNRGETC